MTSPTETAEGAARGLGLLDIHRNQFNTGQPNKAIQVTETFPPISRLDHHRSLNKRRDRHAPGIGSINRIDKRAVFRLALQNGD